MCLQCYYTIAINCFKGVFYYYTNLELVELVLHMCMTGFSQGLLLASSLLGLGSHSSYASSAIFSIVSFDSWTNPCLEYLGLVLLQVS